MFCFRWFLRRAKTIAMNFAKSGTIIEEINNFHQYVYSPYYSLYISKEADKENLFNNQELL